MEVSPHCVLIALFGTSGQYLWSTLYKHSDTGAFIHLRRCGSKRHRCSRQDSILATDSKTEHDMSPRSLPVLVAVEYSSSAHPFMIKHKNLYFFSIMLPHAMNNRAWTIRVVNVATFRINCSLVAMVTCFSSLRLMEVLGDHQSVNENKYINSVKSCYYRIFVIFLLEFLPWVKLVVTTISCQLYLSDTVHASIHIAHLVHTLLAH